MSACRPFSLPQEKLAVSCGSAARLSEPHRILADLSADLSDTRASLTDILARILARISVKKNARVYTCERVLYTISYRIHVYKITR